MITFVAISPWFTNGSLDFTSIPLQRQGGSPVARWGRIRATSGTGGRLSSPLAAMATTRPRRHARGHVDSNEARGGGGQCAAMEALLMSREGVGMVGRQRKLEETRAHDDGGNGGRWTAVFSRGSHKRWAFIADMRTQWHLRFIAKRPTRASLNVRARRADRPHCCERAHIT
jgi:hypothetical protein